jgi:alpha-ketoglutarate-dependent taurine dioxygenase
MSVLTSPARPIDGSFVAQMARDGYVFLKRWHPDEHSEVLFYRIGPTLTFGKNGPVHRLQPQHEATPNTYSGIYGLGAFPFHSDMAHWRNPPRILMLRCIKGHASVVTMLVDGVDVVDCAGEENLSRALVRPRRPHNGSMPLLPLHRPRREERPSLLRWDEKFIVPASHAGEQGMKFIREALTHIRKTSIALSCPGDTLFIDNWRMLHGRSPVAADQIDRTIERAYLGGLY